MFVASVNVRFVGANGTVYIRADGSVDPPTAPISTLDNVTYTFTDNIDDSIVAERDNIVVDGVGYIVQGTKASGSKGIDLSYRNNVTIKNTQIKNFTYGIYLYETLDNSISENNITDSTEGIKLYYSSNNTITGNIVMNNSDAVVLYSSSNNSLISNNITTNSFDGTILESFCDNNSMVENSLTSNRRGIWIGSNCSYNSIALNDITENNYEGVCIKSFSSYNNIMENNIARNSYEGIKLWESCHNNSITGNNITANNWQGILLSTSNHNNVTGNNIRENGYEGVCLDSSPNNTISRNTVVDNYGGIWFASSRYNIVSNNNVSSNDYVGIRLDYSEASFNEISGNDFSNSDYGVFLASSANNTIVDNAITNNNHGIYVSGSSSNAFFYNNIVNNSQQVVSYDSTNLWDNGYPSGGNYWNDYAGVDFCSGPYQNETGSDGMGDTAYVIDANNQDNYPLMNPWPSGWKLDFAGPTNHPIVDFAVYNGSLYAAADNKLYVKNGSSWNVIGSPTFVTSLEPYGGKLVVGGQGGLYCYDGTSFSLIFSVPTYIRVLGACNNTLYAGTMLDKTPKLYYCNGSADNPADWHVDMGFSTILNFSGAFGSIDSFAAYNSGVESPVGYWRFDEGAGNIVHDSSGNGHDGAIYGASWAVGKTGYGLHFDGDDLVEIPDSPDLNPAEITVEMWANFGRLAYGGGTSGTDNQMLVCKGGWPRVGSYRIWQGGPNSSFQVLSFDLGPGTYVASPELILQTDRWYRIVGTYDGDMIKLYLDGVLQASRSIGRVQVGNAESLYFGYHDEDEWNYYLNGTLDEVAIYDHAKTAEEIQDDYSSQCGDLYIGSGNRVFRYDGTAWSVALSYEYAYAFLDMQVYNSKLYLATRDLNRIPLYVGGTGFSGTLIEYDGENWTTILGHDYWIYSLEVYDGKLYVGTANRIYTYNGTQWDVSFYAENGAFYAISMITYDGKIYAGMGNGYIFADPAPTTASPDTIVVPEFPSPAILAIFMALTMLAAALTRKNRNKRFN